MTLRKGSNKQTSYSGSMVEPSNPYSREVWLQRQKQQQRQSRLQHRQNQSPNWVLPLIIGIIVLVIIPLAIIVATQKKSTEDVSEPIPEPEISDEDDLSAYYYELVSDPDYVPLFDNDISRYTKVPAKVSCDEFKQVSHMNADILNLYLNSGYVVVISDGNNSTLVYQGMLDVYSYSAIPINCPNIDTSATTRTYSSEELFENPSSKRQYYVWIDPANLNQDKEGL